MAGTGLRVSERAADSGANCGTGIDAVHLAERGIEVLACDLSPRMIELATGRSIAANVAIWPIFRVMPTEDISELMTEGPFDGVCPIFLD